MKITAWIIVAVLVFIWSLFAAYGINQFGTYVGWW